MRKLAITCGLVVGFVAAASAIDLIPRSSLFNFQWLASMAQPSNVSRKITGEAASIPKGVVTPREGSINLIGDFDIAAPEAQTDEGASAGSGEAASSSDDCQDGQAVEAGASDDGSADDETAAADCEVAKADHDIAMADHETAMADHEAAMADSAAALADGEDQEVTAKQLLEEAKKLRIQAEKLERAASKLSGKAAEFMPQVPTMREFPAMPDMKFDMVIPPMDMKQFEELKALQGLKLKDGGVAYVMGFNDMDLVERARELATKNQSDKKVQDEWQKLAKEWGKRLAESEKNRKVRFMNGPMTEAQRKQFEQNMRKMRSDMRSIAPRVREEMNRQSQRSTSPKPSKNTSTSTTNAITIPIGSGGSLSIQVSPSLSSTTKEAN